MRDKLREAAKTLEASLRKAPWLYAVGIVDTKGAEMLIVYASREEMQGSEDRIPEKWEGIPVAIRIISGKPEPQAHEHRIKKAGTGK